jgi:putative transposase
MKKDNWISARTCVYNIGYHFVWSTKYRRMVLINEIESCLKELMGKIANENDFIIENVEVMPDHCHVFVVAHPKRAPSTIAKLLKGISARRLFQEFPDLKKVLWKGHLWNPSYYVGTAGSVSKEVIKRYIDEQKS